MPWVPNAATSFTHAQLPGFFGQIIRGFPDATNPSTGSPFGWFYLPTNTGGAEIMLSLSTTEDITRFFGYSMDAQAVIETQSIQLIHLQGMVNNLIQQM